MGKLSMLVVLLAALVASTAAQGSDGIPSCATKLAPCFSYLNATKTPDTSCCTPLKEAVTKERKCLCDIYNNPALIQAFHINVTQALNLITLCHINTVKDPSTFCKDLAQAPSPSSSPAAGSTPTPPGGSSTSSPPGNAAPKITGAGSVGIVSILLMFGAYTMF
ncbi:lipid transfer-like protein VAS [Chenopodium quinoa]|uniref:lipid transfer-like protein VAS n=1 Tax=Chenopodium quinoa TaxID=63459 RepID=UPI000B77E9FA|nr:lipid transfer-like protein VAS [Chenopodium quinoa]